MSFGRKWKNWGGLGDKVPETYQIVQVHVDMDKVWDELDLEEVEALAAPFRASGLELGPHGVTVPIPIYKLHREVFEAVRTYPDLVEIKDITSKYRFFRTSCPPAYDGFSVLEMEKKNGTRVVAIQEKDVDWYMGRCGSGLHAVVPLEKWEPHFDGFGEAAEVPLKARGWKTRGKAPRGYKRAYNVIAKFLDELDHKYASHRGESSMNDLIVFMGDEARRYCDCQKCGICVTYDGDAYDWLSLESWGVGDKNHWELYERLSNAGYLFEAVNNWSAGVYKD